MKMKNVNKAVAELVVLLSAISFSFTAISDADSSIFCRLYQISQSPTDKFTICDGAYIRSGEKTYTARDYVQNGLLAIWDAKENVGYDSHSQDASVWKDLTGHGNDLTVYYTNWWTECSVVCDGMNRFASRESFTTTDNLSIDCCYKLASDAENGNCVFYVSESGEYRSKKRFSSKSIKRSKSTSEITYFIKSTGIDDSYSCGVFDFARHSTFTYVKDANEFGLNDVLYIDGANVTEIDQYEWGTPDATEYVGISVSAGGTFMYAPDWPFKGEINCIRVYSRKLTESEIMHNHIVDKARFGE